MVGLVGIVVVVVIVYSILCLCRMCQGFVTTGVVCFSMFLLLFV